MGKANYVGEDNSFSTMATYHDHPDSQINKAKNEVNEVLDVMRNNVTKMMDREEKLTDLDTRASNLEQSSIQFSTTSRRLKKKMWWENLKMKIIIGGVVATTILIVIIVLIVKYGGGSDDDSGNDSENTTKSN